MSQHSDAKHHAAEFAAELSAATLKAYERYAVEVVERFGFCPWARAARESGNVTLRVVFSADHDDFDESLRLLSELHGQAPEPGVDSRADEGASASGTGAEVGASADIALFIYPLLDLDRLGFEDYARRLRARAEAGPGLGHGRLDAFAMAAFHPCADADLSHPRQARSVRA